MFTGRGAAQESIQTEKLYADETFMRRLEATEGESSALRKCGA